MFARIIIFQSNFVNFLKMAIFSKMFIGVA